MPFKRDTDAIAKHGIDLVSIFRDTIDRSGKTRHAIAKELGVSESTLSRPYTGKSVPSLELLCDVAIVAGLRVKITTTKVRKANR